jgi:hypothetical protein
MRGQFWIGRSELLDIGRRSIGRVRNKRRRWEREYMIGINEEKERI